MSAGPRTRRLHRALGLLLTLPILLWAATGLLFHVKPGWEGAYAALAPVAQPMSGTLAIHPGADWIELRALRTSLGEHWLVRTPAGRLHLDSAGKPFPRPPGERLAAWIDEALASDPERYGRVLAPDPDDADGFVTTTGVHVGLDWESLRLSQRGPDTARIDALYRLHYLQWTGVPALDRPLALLGLAGLGALALLGLRLARPAKDAA